MQRTTQYPRQLSLRPCPGHGSFVCTSLLCLAWQGLRSGLLVLTILGLGGCATGPLIENPVPVRTHTTHACENPVYIPQGPMAYSLVFDKTLNVLDDYFEIAYANRFDGRIETHPGIAPGLEQPWKPGSPDFYQRLLASFQTIRHRCIALIRTADDGGFFIDIKVYKELEDIPQPTNARAGAAIFRLDTPSERQYEVIEPTEFENNWIPIGRDCELEQVILRRLAEFDLSAKQPDHFEPK